MVVPCLAMHVTTMLLPGSYQGTTMLLGSDQGVGGLPLPGGILSRKHSSATKAKGPQRREERGETGAGT